MSDREQPRSPHRDSGDERDRQSKREPDELAMLRALAVKSSQSMLALSAVADSAPPVHRVVIETALDSLYHAATHIYAMLDEGGECAERITSRARRIERRMHADAERLNENIGQLISDFFHEQARKARDRDQSRSTQRDSGSDFEAR